MLRRQGSFFPLCVAVAGMCSLPAPVGAVEDYINPVPIPIPVVALSSNATEEAQMVADINSARTAAGLSPLTIDSKLSEVARAYAHDMALRRYFGHLSPEGKSVADRFDVAGIDYQCAGENIAFVQDEEEAMAGFLHSSDHRANILSKRYTRIGVGIIIAGSYGSIFVQEFSDG